MAPFNRTLQFKFELSLYNSTTLMRFGTTWLRAEPAHGISGDSVSTAVGFLFIFDGVAPDIQPWASPLLVP